MTAPGAKESSVRTYLLDTNVILRFITGLPEDHFAAAEKLFARADRGEIRLVLASVITAETVYVLESFYEVGRADIAGSLVPLVRAAHIRVPERSILLDALERYQRSKLAFADCYLAANAKDSSHGVVTFDKGLRKLTDLDVIVPPGT